MKTPVSKKRGRPPLPLSDEERAERLAAQRAAAHQRLRARVAYLSVPCEPEVLDWIDEMRSTGRPILGRGTYVASIIQRAMEVEATKTARKTARKKST